jgi:hypothetical protein
MLALPGAASAGVIYQQHSGYKSNVGYDDFASETNTVVAKVVMGGYGVRVTDSTATITTIAPWEVTAQTYPCTIVHPHEALCVNPRPHPEEFGGFERAFLNVGLGLGDDSFEMATDSLAPELWVSGAAGDDVITVDGVVTASVSDFDGANTIRVGRTEQPSRVSGGQGPDQIDVRNGTGGDEVRCSWREEILPEGDFVSADADDVIDPDCG